MDKLEEYLFEAVKRNAGKIEGSKVFVSLCTKDYIKDPICALQLGIAIMLDKPIRLLVPKGTVIPIHLKKIADKIEYFDNADDIGLITEKLLEDLK